MPLPFFGLGVAAIGARAERLRGRDRRLLQERHAESARFQSLVEHLPVVTYIDSLDDPPVTLYMSDQIEDLTGFSSEEFRSDPQLWRARVPEPHRVVSDAAFAKHRETGEPLSCEHPFLRRDGRRIWLAYRARIVTSDEGRGLFSEGVVFDVTESKERERPLLRRLEILAATFEGSPNGAAIMLSGGGIVRANPALEKITGFSAHELNSMSFRDLVDPGLDPERAARLERTLRGEVGSRQCELHLVTKDGGRVRGRITILTGQESEQDGAPLLCAVVEDVTEHQKTLQRLRERERMLAEAERIGQLGSVEWDISAQTVTWSDELFRIFGVVPDAFVPSYEAWLEFVHPEDRDEVHAFARRVVVEGGPYDVYFRIISRDGRGTRLLHSRAEAERDASGHPARIMAACRDVTEQMADKSALASQVARSRLLSSIARASNTSSAVDEVLQLALKEVCLFAGWDVAHSFLVDEQDGEAVLASHRWFQSDDRDIAEFRLVTESESSVATRGLPSRVLESRAFVSMPDLGDETAFPRREVADRCGIRSGHAFPILSGSSVLGVLEFFSFERSQIDADLEQLMVTVGVQLGRALERQRSSAALRESEERFRSLAETAIDAIVSADHRGDIWYVNPAVESTFGYSRDELLDKPLTMLMPERFRGPHSAGLQAFVRSGQGKVMGNIFHQMALKKDGSEFPVEIALSHRVTSQGIVFTSMIRDISDRVASEQQLHQSLSLLNATFDSIADGIIAINHVGDRVLDHNRRFQEIWGLTEEDLASGDAHLVLERLLAQTKQPDAVRKMFMEALTHPEKETYGVLELLDGRTIERRVVPQRLDGKVVGRVASYRDITQERSANALLLDEARILEAVARDVPLHSVLDDLCRTVERYAVGAKCSVLLLSEGETLRFAAGPSLEDFYTDLGPVPIGDGVGSCGTAAHTGRSVLCEDVQVDPFWTDYAAIANAHGIRSAWSIPVKSSGGAVIGTFALYHPIPRRPSEEELSLVEVSSSLAAVAIERDVAHRQRLFLEDRIRQSEKMESVGRLAGGLAHDLGNVLSAVTVNCDLLRHEITSDRGRESLHDLEVAAGMAGRLVDDLLNLMRPPNPRVVDLNSLVAEMKSLLESVGLQNAHIEIELEASPSLTRIDPEQLRQVLLNLVMNSKEAMPDGGTVTVRTTNPRLSAGTRGPDEVVLTVTDSGIGMDAETQQQAFEPFFTTKRGPGTKGVGLGLASAYAAVTQVGGHISLLSSPGRGTVVSISLPCAGEEEDINE